MKKYQKIEYGLENFGIKEVNHGQIRFDLLEERLKPNIAFPHKHGFYQVLLMTEGGGSHTIDFHTYTALPRSLFIMKPGQMHSWNFTPSTKGIIFEFNRESVNFFEGLQLLNELDNCVDFIQLEPHYYKNFYELYHRGVQSYEEENRFHELNLKAYLIIILTHMLQIPKVSAHTTKVNSTASQFKILLEEHFKTNHEVEFYAQQLHMSSKNLSMQITRSLGKSPRALIQNRIVLEAKRYLIYSNDPIGLIAENLGFEDQNYFARFFKKNEGKTPRDFRDFLK